MSAQTFSLPLTDFFNTPINITAVYGPWPSQPLLGAVGGLGGYFFGLGQVGFVVVYFCSALLLIYFSTRYAYLAGVMHGMFAGFIHPMIH